MRILALTTSYPLRAGMAAGVFVQRLYAHLPPQCSIEVLSPDDDSRPSESSANVVPPVTPLRYAPRGWQRLGQRNGGILPALRANRGLLLLVPSFLAALSWGTFRRARHADVIHANWSICGVIGALVGAVTGVKLVTTLRGEDTGSGRGSPWTRVLLGITAWRSDAIVCVSAAMAQGVADLHPRHAAKIHVIHNGVDRALYMLAHPVPVAGRLRLLVVGSIVRRKGLDVLLAALAATKADCQIDLTVAGDGPDRTALQAFAAGLPPGREVVWLGEVPPDQVPSLLSKSDVLVLSSRSEGRPNVVLEALAAGLPVISTKLPGVAGLVEDGETGWLVDVEDVDGMARAIENACDVPDRLRLGENARRESMARNESWEATAAAYAALFESVVAGHGKAS
ncbi:glycosyltransferase family 4 protein [Luteimonas sp. A611]